MAGSHAIGAFTRIKVGGIEVIPLADGRLDLPLALFGDRAATAEQSVGPGPFPTAINTFAIRTGGRLYLVDAGAGHWRGPTTGHLAASLQQAGIAPGEIDAILMTHLHGDHAGGLINEAGAAFPKAELLLAEEEAAFWLDEGLPSRAPERMQATIATAIRSLDAYRGRTTQFRAGAIVAPGVTAELLPGHTPGQTGFRIADGGEEIFIWADIVHIAAIQFAHPDWPIGFDVDGAQAVETRLRVLAGSAAEGTRILGMHLDFPGAGQVVKAGTGFAWQPAA
jgi:glyoxylase-like metal-dependent hydrolase (beta-lactamase superfamily II)